MYRKLDKEKDFQQIIWLISYHNVRCKKQNKFSIFPACQQASLLEYYKKSDFLYLWFFLPPCACEESTDEEDDKNSTEDEDEGYVWSTGVDWSIMETKIQVVIGKMIRNILLGFVITEHCHLESEISIFVLEFLKARMIWWTKILITYKFKEIEIKLSASYKDKYLAKKE